MSAAACAMPKDNRGTISLGEQMYLGLLRAQNADGGWGYQLGSSSRAEPSSWALLALGECQTAELSEVVRRGCEWLRQTQLSDGAWPAVLGQKQGCWVTALACLALQRVERSSTAALRGLNWLCRQWPGEGGLWWRVSGLLGRRKRGKVTTQNDRYRGWSWTPGTASWVEPTAYSLILLRNTPRHLWPKVAPKRQRLGRAMLYDRMCPGGGWNAGNPVVYGVVGEPLVIPTSCALLALRDEGDCPQIGQSLDWLEASLNLSVGSASVALAHMCLQSYGRRMPPLEPRIREMRARNGCLENVPAMSWVALALGPVPHWLGRGQE